MDRQYIWDVLPFGLKNAPKTFARALAETLSEAVQQGLVFMFYDNIVVPSMTLEENRDATGLVLSLLKKDGWKLNKQKGQWAERKIDVFGHSSVPSTSMSRR